MKHLFVTEVNNGVEDIKAAAAYLDNLEKHALSHAPWHTHPYKPKTSFSIAHSKEYIYLKYYVEERSIRAVNAIINSPVWEDSCVEFFISFDDAGYYNLEFNCIGTALIGFGKERSNRQLLPEALIKQVKYGAAIYYNDDDSEHIKWELTIVIPVTVFVHHKFSSFKSKEYRANFYKCGDNLPEPHFIAWSNIESPEPDFHLPQFFGVLLFE